MSAPAGISHAAQRAAWPKLWAILLADEPASATADTADHRRPLGAGDRLQTHNGPVSACQQDDEAVEEDARHAHTSAAD